MEIKTVIQRVRRIVLSLSRSQDRADDIAQDALLKILQTKSTPRKICSSWIYMVAKNCFLDACKKRATEAKYLDSNYFVDSAGVVCDGEGNEYDNVIPFPSLLDPLNQIDPENLEKIERIFESLSLPLQQVLILRTEGLTYREMADEIGINIGTVRSRLHRARKLACEILAGM